MNISKNGKFQPKWHVKIYVAYFGVPNEMSKSGNFSPANFGNLLLLPVLDTSVLHQMWHHLQYPWKCPIVEIFGIPCETAKKTLTLHSITEISL